MHPKQTNLMIQMLARGIMLLAGVSTFGCESAPQYADTSTVNDSDTPTIMDDEELSPSIDGEKRTTVTIKALHFDAHAFSMRVETPGSARSTFNATEPTCPIPPCVIEPSIEVVGGGFTVRFAIDRTGVGKLDKPIFKVTGVPRGQPGAQPVTRIINAPLQFDWNETGDTLTLEVAKTELEKISSAELSWVANDNNANVANLPPWNVDLLQSGTDAPHSNAVSTGTPQARCCEYDCQCIGGKVSCRCTFSVPGTYQCP